MSDSDLHVIITYCGIESKKQSEYPKSMAAESESEGILGTVGVGRNFYVESESKSVKTYRLRLRTQSKILTRYSKPRALVAAVTIRFILKCRL
jgi:hypothetical protein